MLPKVRLLWLLLLPVNSVYAQTYSVDTLTREQFVKKQTLVGDSLNRVALELATPTAPKKQYDHAIADIMTGLHIYSRYRDTLGLRQSFDNLATVYFLQKKYSQAKWFGLQSNALSRQTKDTANIINSLVNLAAVKREIKDHVLAEKDLNEAAYLADVSHDHATQIKVLEDLALTYQQGGDMNGQLTALDKVARIRDSIAVSLLAIKNSPHLFRPVNPDMRDTTEEVSFYMAGRGTRASNILKTIALILSFVAVLILSVGLIQKYKDEEELDRE